MNRFIVGLCIAVFMIVAGCSQQSGQSGGSRDLGSVGGASLTVTLGTSGQAPSNARAISSSITNTVGSSQIVSAVITLSSGTEQYTKNWAVGGASSFTFQALHTGTYTLTVTDTDDAGHTNSSSTSFNLQFGYNYTVSVQLGGVIYIGIVTDGVVMPASVVISDFSVAATGNPFHLTVAADGGMVYFTESNTNRLGSFNTLFNTLSREYTTDQPAYDIQWNPVYGNVYFTGGGYGSGYYGILEPSTGSVNTHPSGLQAASAVDCNVDQSGVFWFNGWDSQSLVSVIGSTIDHLYALPAFGYTSGLAIDSDGNKWLTIVGAYENSPSLVKISAAGAFSTIPLPGVAQATIRFPLAAFGKIWFCNGIYRNGYTSQASIGAYDTTSGAFDQFDIPTPNSGCAALADDTQGRIWFAAPNANQIGVLNPETREVHMYDVPTANSGVADLAIDKDRRVIWFTEPTSNKIGKLLFSDIN